MNSKKFLLVLLSLLLIANVVFGSVFAAADTNCPAPLTLQDCKALYINYTKWVPSGDTTCASSDDSTTLSGSGPRQQAYNFFLGKGLNDVQASAIIGNFMIESSMIPTADNGSHHGIAQWDYAGRYANLKTYASQQGQDPDSLTTQLNFAWAELQGQAPAGDYSSVLKQLKTYTGADQVPAATTYFQDNYEGAPGQADQQRIEAAQSAYQDFAGTTSGAVSGSDSSCGSVGAVNCNSSDTTTSGTSLSQVRQNVVCLTQGELALWTSGKMKAGTDFGKYSQGITDSTQLWCADFVSWIYMKAGYPLGPSTSNWRIAAVKDVKQIGQADDKFHYHPAGSYTPRPGDIIVHQENGESHVNIVISVNTNNTSMVVIGGDQHGSGGANGNVVNEYTDSAFVGVDDITGYVSPD